jgi:alpha-L-rhamnosidase
MVSGWWVRLGLMVSVGMGGMQAWAAKGVAVTAPVEWKASWVEAPAGAGDAADAAVMPLFRKTFVLKKRPVRAVMYVSALGQGEVHLNGAKVGDAELAPAWTDYRKTVRYETYDVTAMLRVGANAVGVMVGNGMYNVVKTPHRYTKLENSFGRPKVILHGRLLRGLLLSLRPMVVRTTMRRGSWRSGMSRVVQVRRGER